MTITRNFKLCLNAGTQNAPYINVNQYDEGEEWVFTLYNEDGSTYTPSSGAIIGIKSDGNAIMNSGSVVGGKVVINETQQMTAASGRAIYELLIDNATHGTANFIVNVERRPSDDAEFSDSDLSMLQEAINSATEIEDLLGGQDVPTVITPIISDWLDENITNPSNPPIDTSLTVAGAAADAKKTGDEITDLKSAILKSNDGVQTFYGLGNFQHYGISTSGEFITNQKYRVSNNDPMTFDRDITISVKNGYRWGYLPYADGSYGAYRGWFTTPQTITAGTSFIVQIARVTEVTSEVADVSEFVNTVTFDTSNSEQIAENKKQIDNLYSISSGNNWTFTTVGGRSNTYDIQLIKNTPYTFINNTSGDINLNAVKKDGTVFNIQNGVHAGNSITFIPTDYYEYVSGWVINSGTVSVVVNGIQTELNSVGERIGFIGVEGWEIGGVSGGIETNVTNRIRSKLTLMGNKLTISVNSPYYYGLAFFDENGTFTSETTWLQGVHEYTQDSSKSYFRMMMRKADNSVIAPSESSNASIKNVMDDLTGNIINLYDVLGLTHPLTYHGNKMPSYLNTFDFKKLFTMSYQDKTAQDTEAFGNYLFVSFSNDESIRVYSLEDYSMLADISTTTNHGSSMQFADEYYDSADDLPLLYVGGSVDNAISVLRFATNPWSASVVKTLKFPTSLGYYLSPNIDGNTLVLFGYKGADITSADMVIIRCDLKDMTDNGDGTYTPEVLGTVNIPHLGVYQGHKYLNGCIYVAFSNTSSPYNPRIIGIDIGSGNIVTDIDINPIVNSELEGLCFLEENGKIRWFMSEYYNVYELFF